MIVADADIEREGPAQQITVQFDTGSAIVYVLTDKCKEDCNKQTKFTETNSLAGPDDLMSRIEYGYGSGYINGFINEQPICFSADSLAPCIHGVKILEADQATGVSQDRFAGIVGLSPRSTETNL